MTSTPTGRRLALALPLTVVIAALLMLLAIPGLALAKGTSCTTAHARRAAHTCAQSRSKAKKHHAKHAIKKKAKKKKAGANPSVVASEAQPVCEDGSAPTALGGGSYSCEDESEPSCENGSEPELSASSGTLVCPALPEGAAGPVEPVCEDGSAPVRSAAGSYSCDDESEPECENGSAPTLSSTGTLACPASPNVAEAASEFDSDGLLGTLVSVTRPGLER